MKIQRILNSVAAILGLLVVLIASTKHEPYSLALGAVLTIAAAIREIAFAVEDK